MFSYYHIPPKALLVEDSQFIRDSKTLTSHLALHCYWIRLGDGQSLAHRNIVDLHTCQQRV